MKEYLKPEINEEIIELEDVIAASADVDINKIFDDGDKLFPDVK